MARRQRLIGKTPKTAELTAWQTDAYLAAGQLMRDLDTATSSTQ
mgnify:CR=1 FL=1